MATEDVNNLTAKQSAFIDEYMVDFNGTQSAIRAGYSESTAQQIASENLSKPLIAEELKKRIENRSKKVGLTAEKVLSDIALIKADAMQTIYDKDGNAIMLDRPAALKASELEGKHLKMFTDKIDLSGNVSLTVLSNVPQPVNAS